MESNHVIYSAENFYGQPAINQPPNSPIIYTSPMPMPVYRTQNNCDCCIVVMIIFGILLAIGGIVLIILGKVVFYGYQDCSYSYFYYYYYCSYYSNGQSIFVGVGAGILALGCILIIIAVVLKIRNSKQPQPTVGAYPMPMGTV